MKNGKLLAGVIAGLGAGALLGILFAPAKGSATRKKLLKSCKAEEGKVNIHDVMSRNKEKLKHHLEADDLQHSIN